jgi:hypothetical protein
LAGSGGSDTLLKGAAGMHVEGGSSYSSTAWRRGERGSGRRWRTTGPTTCSFDLNLILILVLNLILKLNIHFITDQYIERLHHNSQLRITRLNNYHTFFHSKIDSYFILGTLVSNNHRLSLKPMPATCSLNILGGKPFINGPTSIYLVLMCSRLIV